ARRGGAEMEKREAWREPHEEAVGELGPIRFAGRTPPKYAWVIIPLVLSVIFIALLGVLLWTGGPAPPAGGDPRALTKAENERTVLIACTVIVTVMCVGFLVLGYVVFRTAWAGSYSLHEKGAMSVLWGRPARLRYEDVDELTVRGQRVFVNGAYIGSAQW